MHVWDRSHTLVLASASPQRRAILEQLGVAFDARPTDAPETDEGEPFAVAAENARRKAAAARDALTLNERQSTVILACDTVVGLEGRVYGKPHDEMEARSFLDELQGETHDVLGALAIVTPAGDVLERTDRTLVTFAALDHAQISAYASTGEWRGRAGGYAIQGRGAALIERIEGDYLNVVGLPVPALRGLVQGLVPPF